MGDGEGKHHINMTRMERQRLVFALSSALLALHVIGPVWGLLSGDRSLTDVEGLMSSGNHRVLARLSESSVGGSNPHYESHPWNSWGLEKLKNSKSPLHRGSGRFFLDTAVTNDWEDLLPLGIFHGVTTNPTLLERAKQPCTVDNLQKLAQTAFTDYHVQEFMCQSWGESAGDMYRRGMALSEVDRARVVVKVPVTREGTQAASGLIASGVRVCLTACYSSHQAHVAASVGAEYLAPYLGRMTDAGKNGLDECLRMQGIVDGMGSDTRILAASIRELESMGDLARAGVDTFTFSPEVARMMFAEPLTRTASEDFNMAASRGSTAKYDDDKQQSFR